MISVITPVHNTKYLEEAYQSLLRQTRQEWEWIVLLNGGVDILALTKCSFLADPRVKVSIGQSSGLVGDLKNQACALATGEVIVELDHDDILLPHALDKILEAFTDPDVVFVYSNSAHFNDSDKTPYVFNPDYGWKYREKTVGGVPYRETLSQEANPQNLSYIWYAPDHVRAWRKDVYERIGGHNREMRILDDQDLICRLYLEGKFAHIDELLYLYRVHGENSWLKHNDEIQEGTVRLHDAYLEPMMHRWCKTEGLKKVDLCSGFACPEGYELLDKTTGADLDKRWEFEDSSVGLIRAVDAIEHLKDPIHTMNEAYRVLAHGGLFMIEVPSTDGRGAFQDPTHCSFWNENSFWYYTSLEHNRYLGNSCPVRFQVSRLTTYFPNEFCRLNNISYVRAHLTALKNHDGAYLGLTGI